MLNDILIFTILVLSIFGYGLCLNQYLLGNSTVDPGSRYLYSAGLGIGCMGHLSLIVGSLFGVTTISIGFVLLIGVLGLLYVIIQGFQNHRIELRLQSIKPDLLRLILGSLLVIAIFYPLIANALIPPVSYDEVAYHLAIPKLFIQDQRISYISFIPYSNWPMEAEMISMIGLLFKSEITAHIVTWFCFVVICSGLYLVGSRYFNRTAGMLSALMFAGTGMITSIAGTALVEIPLTLFACLAFIAFLGWLDGQETRLLSLSAIFAGLAAATKLNAALIPLLLGLVVLIVVWFRSRSFKPALIKFILYGAIAFAVVLPWYIKSWILTGNPLWPFLMGIFPTRNWDQVGMDYLMTFIQQPNLPLTPWNYLKAFWLISVKPGEIGPLTFRLGWSYLALLPVAILGLIRKTPGAIHMRWLAGLALIFYTSWFFQTHQARFLMPVVPLLALLCAGGMAWLMAKVPRWTRAVCTLIVVVVVILNSWVMSPGEGEKLADNWRIISGKTSRENFLVNRISGMDAFVYANQNLPENAFVWLALYEGRGYYLERTYEWASPLNQRVIPLEKMLSSEELLAVLQDRHFSHIIFRTGQPERFRYIVNGDQITDLIYDLLENHAELLYRSTNWGEAVEVYKLIY